MCLLFAGSFCIILVNPQTLLASPFYIVQALMSHMYPAPDLWIDILKKKLRWGNEKIRPSF